MEADIRRALDNNEFDVHYQPLVDNRTDHIVGAEGLVRWKHSTRGDVAPDLFVPIAEEAGLIAILANAFSTARARPCSTGTASVIPT